VEARVRILVVDDFEEARDITEAALISAGYKDVVTANSASDALHLLNIWRPIDVILLDIVMPKVDGIETCVRIRKDARYSDVPIIMLTSVDNMDALADAFVAGANDYIAKPFTPTDLVARIESAVKSEDGP
jgi:CheY-like chemotaxis protein